MYFSPYLLPLCDINENVILFNFYVNFKAVQGT